jgi:alkyldihydroxyacetonephosphate synthase
VSGGDRARRLDGWGFEGTTYEVSPQLADWLESRLGKPRALPALDREKLHVPDPASLPELGCATSTDPLDRLAHSRGRGFSDLVFLRTGTVPRLPDTVARPTSTEELHAVLATAGRHGLRVVPWGGGTSVTGGVNPPPGPEPVVTLDLAGLGGLEHLDPVSGLATFGAGTAGPAVEAALEPHGFTLGHFPQSWELSTVGGWVATRSSGQESLGYGRIEDLVAGVDLVAPAGELRLPALPASAAGPDLRHLVMGSEGRFGVIRRATLRVRPRPDQRRFEAFLVRGWEAGQEAARTLVKARAGLSLLRLSDVRETEVAMAIGIAKNRFAPLIQSWLRLRRMDRDTCLLLLGSHGTALELDALWDRVRDLLRPFPTASLGTGPGRRWLGERFHHPYLRDSLFDLGYGTDTFETAAPWSRLGELYTAVRRSLVDAVAEGEKEIPVLCHLSHPYEDGASLYFTFFFRCPEGSTAAVERWADLKRRATEALVEAGGTLSHHHGVGSWHAPWYPREAGEQGHRVLARAAAELDPEGVLNPHVLLDPTDRLED